MRDSYRRLYAAVRKQLHWRGLLGPYAVAFLLTAGLLHSRITESLDLILYDLVVEAHSSQSADSAPVSLITISEADIRRFGWPIDDRLLCEAIDRLAEGGASAIGLDLYRNRGVGEREACLRRSAREQERLVTIANVSAGIEAVPGTPPERQAFNDLVMDSDGVIRRDLIHVGGQDSATVALPLRLVSLARQRPDLGDSIEADVLASGWLEAGSGGYLTMDAAGYQRMLVYREPGSFRTHHLGALLDGRVPEGDISGRIVLIGSSAPSLKDLFEVPHSRFRDSASSYLMPGVELHAHRTANLLALLDGDQRGQIHPAPAWLDHALLLTALAGGLLLGEAVPSLKRSALFAGVVAASLLGSGAVLLWHGLWVGPVLPTATLMIWAGGGWVRRGAASQQQRVQIQRLLGQSTSPAVAEQLWAQRDELLSNGRFEGRDIPVTIMFSDTCNFTTLAEHMPPADLLAWLNRGMERFVPVISNRGGMVNKFTGDGFLAVFGAPVGEGPQRDAQAAIHSALAIQEEVEALNQELASEGKPALRLRIGIHSGNVLAGSMGSRERLEYAVIGDAVNCASRLESHQKTRQTNLCRVLVSSTTRQLLDPEQPLQWQAWGELRVKGRRDPLEIWELRGT